MFTKTINTIKKYFRSLHNKSIKINSIQKRTRMQDLMHSKYDSETLKCNELKFEKCILTGSFLPLLDILPAAS